MDELPLDKSPRDECGVSKDLLDQTSDIQQMASSEELFWHDAHFAETEPSERMFTSLQLSGSSTSYEFFESHQHHSLDYMSSHCHQRASAKGFTANGKSDIMDGDDDDDDIDIESMKNKFLSAWTNAKNG